MATSRPTPHFELFTWFGEELDKRTKGQIKTDVVSLPELGLTGFELVRVTRAGLVDFADVILAYAAGEVPVIEGDRRSPTGHGWWFRTRPDRAGEAGARNAGLLGASDYFVRWRRARSVATGSILPPAMTTP